MEIYFGAAAFWIALAAVLIAGGWFKMRREAIKQDTLLRLIERTGQLDEAQVKALFPPPPPLPPHWFRPPNPTPDGRIPLKVFGTIALAVAVGLTVFFTIFANFGAGWQQAEAVSGFAAASLVACIGIGLFVAARFVRPPPKEQGNDGENVKVESPLSAADLAAAADPLVIALACAGDTRAFTEVVKRRHVPVRKFMYHLCRRPALGEDLAQQVFLTAWRSIGQLRSATASK
jgi:hypothetical protein